MAQSLIQRLEAFARLSSEDRAAIQRVVKVTRTIPARRDLIREGERPAYVHLIVDGWACRYKTLPDGRRQIVAFFVPGDFCDLNVYVLKQMDHSLGAITRIAVADISREDMDRMTADQPRITQALWWEALVNNAIQREWTLNIGQRTAYERISHLLVELYLRLSTVGLARDGYCDFPLTQTDLGDATGLTSVHVNRTLQELRRDGLIKLERRQLNIPDLQRLKEASTAGSTRYIPTTANMPGGSGETPLRRRASSTLNSGCARLMGLGVGQTFERRRFSMGVARSKNGSG